MSPRLRSIVAAFAAVFVLSACTPADPIPTATPTPEPTFQCTPIFSGDVYDCDQTEVDELAAERARYDEAADLYRQVMSGTEVLLAEKRPMSDELSSMLTGEYLEKTTDMLSRFAASSREISGHRTIEWSSPLSNVNQGSDLAIEVCSSPGTFTAVNDGVTADKVSILEYIFLETDGDSMLVASSRNTVVEAC